MMNVYYAMIPSFQYIERVMVFMWHAYIWEYLFGVHFNFLNKVHLLVKNIARLNIFHPPISILRINNKII